MRACASRLGLVGLVSPSPSSFSSPLPPNAAPATIPLAALLPADAPIIMASDVVSLPQSPRRHRWRRDASSDSSGPVAGIDQVEAVVAGPTCGWFTAADARGTAVPWTCPAHNVCATDARRNIVACISTSPTSPIATPAAAASPVTTLPPVITTTHTAADFYTECRDYNQSQWSSCTALPLGVGCCTAAELPACGLVVWADNPGRSMFRCYERATTVTLAETPPVGAAVPDDATQTVTGTATRTTTTTTVLASGSAGGAENSAPAGGQEANALTDGGEGSGAEGSGSGTNGRRTAAIVGGTIGGAALLFIVGFAFAFFLIRRRKNRTTPADGPAAAPTSTSSPSEKPAPGTAAVASNNPRATPDDNWQSPSSHNNTKPSPAPVLSPLSLALQLQLPLPLPLPIYPPATTPSPVRSSPTSPADSASPPSKRPSSRFDGLNLPYPTVALVPASQTTLAGSTSTRAGGAGAAAAGPGSPRSEASSASVAYRSASDLDLALAATRISGASRSSSDSAGSSRIEGRGLQAILGGGGGGAGGEGSFEQVVHIMRTTHGNGHARGESLTLSLDSAPSTSEDLGALATRVAKKY